MKAREGVDLVKVRWAKLEALQAHYADFTSFLEDGMEEIGFTATAIQREIAAWMEHGPQYIMVQAQRGQAKTTVAALFAVWSLIHSPAHRVLIISAGGTQAVEISTLIVRVIMTMDILECMRPDKMAGDRTSVEAFDLHHSLKGLDKSPSVACVGIDSNLQGKRADLLIPDDIESSKNSATPVQRAKLLHLTKDFTSINSTGRIIWLGTPQTLESIYNSLPARGVAIRIWPGRYPSDKQREFYGSCLAPSIARKLAMWPALARGGGLLGDQGQPIDPEILNEDQLQKKERDQGEAYFQLQHMLNTTLSDAMRFPLKPEKLILLDTDLKRGPLTVVRGMTQDLLEEFNTCDHPFKMMRPHEVSKETAAWQSIWAYVDPAAGGVNADETAWAIGAFLNGNIYLLSVGGVPGGYDEEKLLALARALCRFKLDGLTIEKNMGFGAFREVFTPILRKVQKEMSLPQCDISDDLVVGQKELRIINTLSPIVGRGALIVDSAVIDEDRRYAEVYPPSLRQSYSLFYQLHKLSAIRNALIHDDRADALEGLCRHYQEAIALDQAKGLASVRAKALAESIKDPCGHNRYSSIADQKRNSMLRRRR
jgi:hypothetical protein